MRSLKTVLVTAVAVSTLGLGVSAMAVAPASAAIACNKAGECWHVDRRPRYAPALGIVIHPDDWYFHQHWDNDHRWHDYRDGRGYWRNGVWVTF
ncbi:MAG TPA: hypothetical protein VMU59_05675 [Caulobacteraceae bacterium]|nr:hypothetical protein [Caulobacteraceae bacterium]